MSTDTAALVERLETLPYVGGAGSGVDVYMGRDLRREIINAIAGLSSALAETQARLAAIVDCGDLVAQASRSGVVIAGPRADGYKLALGALGNAIEAARTSPPAAAAERGETT